MNNLIFQPAYKIAEMIRTREVSAIEVLDAHLDCTAGGSAAATTTAFTHRAKGLSAGQLLKLIVEKYLIYYAFCVYWTPSCGNSHWARQNGITCWDTNYW